MKFIILYVSYLICYIANSVKSTETQTSTENGIFGSFKMMGHNEKANLKVTKVETKAKSTTTKKVVPPMVSVGDIDMNGANKGIMNALSELDDDKKTPGNIALGAAPYFKGWIQYFKFSSAKNNLKKPTTFYKNMEFFLQRKNAYGKTPAPDFKKKDADGQYILIPDQTHFYATLFATTFNVANSKEVSISLNDNNNFIFYFSFLF
jgi:hypothetical protein